ncbi:alpha/beta fold hydrolase [Pedobacter sp. KBS0701]|uniref:alpha/beta hydrolase family protein n=1 Tax=Pedobacter sp. KBS0701 TaxID=2578106 RepID=UPI00110F07F4|nr:alpha/beta fold hydrolase [Pedobacter sp. KBS0701]QDW24179.1 alpha/beta fold hydrolase [Pedobacter sp. KBS0701]
MISKLIFGFALLCNMVSFAQTTKIVCDSVTFKSTDGKITFGGTFSKPEGKKSFPTVVIVSGTGKQDRDGTMAGHKIFLEIASYLNKNGIAVLRTDDRGTGKTNGTYETATTKDFADDALAAITYLHTRTDINRAKIGLMGHSEGGAVISLAAARSKEVKFLISLAGLAMGGFDAQIKQNEDLVAHSALPDYDKKRSNDINRIMFETALRYANSDSMEVKLNDAYKRWKLKDDIYFKTLNIQFDHFRFPVYSFINNSTGPWYRYFIQYDAKRTIAKIKVPILALNGDKDLMVAADENLSNWKNYSLTGGNKKVTTMKLPGLNHLFLACVTCDNAEISKIKTGFSEDALLIIKNWIKKTIQ